jgi:multisubunit Na+/H+ antiporter MnhE subunit
MPNEKIHMVLGAVAGAGTAILFQRFMRSEEEKEKPLDWVEIGCCAVIGAAAGGLPDILEPATSPNHRSFFHSFLFGAIVLYALGKITPRCLFRLLLYVVGAAYLIQLGVDSQTKKCLPWVC